ncbi:hypothetical protein WMY93_009605 [Mugilogobius chulae]|uniref:Uncharacterized protein n=1 Tax=Mugilogobius chulae TaxID=88201 RepID=A0AAW0PFB2_9GOBI
MREGELERDRERRKRRRKRGEKGRERERGRKREKQKVTGRTKTFLFSVCVCVCGLCLTLASAVNPLLSREQWNRRTHVTEEDVQAQSEEEEDVQAWLREKNTRLRVKRRRTSRRGSGKKTCLRVKRRRTSRRGSGKKTCLRVKRRKTSRHGSGKKHTAQSEEEEDVQAQSEEEEDVQAQSEEEEDVQAWLRGKKKTRLRGKKHTAQSEEEEDVQAWLREKKTRLRVKRRRTSRRGSGKKHMSQSEEEEDVQAWLREKTHGSKRRGGGRPGMAQGKKNTSQSEEEEDVQAWLREKNTRLRGKKHTAQSEEEEDVQAWLREKNTRLRVKRRRTSRRGSGKKTRLWRKSAGINGTSGAFCHRCGPLESELWGALISPPPKHMQRPVLRQNQPTPEYEAAPRALIGPDTANSILEKQLVEDTTFPRCLARGFPRRETENTAAAVATVPRFHPEPKLPGFYVSLRRENSSPHRFCGNLSARGEKPTLLLEHSHYYNKWMRRGDDLTKVSGGASSLCLIPHCKITHPFSDFCA